MNNTNILAFKDGIIFNIHITINKKMKNLFV